MKTFYFLDADSFPIFIAGFLLLILSVVTFELTEKRRLSLALLLLAGLCLCSFAALLDPFLNNWDEQFHALVAKNLISHPFKPTLYDIPILGYDASNWTANHVWLHKQPLFLWQMALSLKFFGLNEFALRLPSVLMMSIAPLFIYRMGKLTANVKTGYYGAVLFASSFFVHELCTGFPPSEHNDIAFLFYITASIWAWVEYENSQKKYWLILIGLFSGCAVLVKWLTGLLVFSGWGLSILFDKEKRTNRKQYLNVGLSFIVCLIVFLPWQLHILNAFPEESRAEYALNTKHFFEVVEDHGGDAFYYVNNISDVYGAGDLLPFLILLSLFFFYKSIKENRFRIAFFTYIIIVYVFFSLAATKMIAFCFIVSPLIFLSLASLMDNAFTFLSAKVLKNRVLQKIVILLVLVLVAWGNFDLRQIAYKHTLELRPDDNDARIEKVRDAVFIKSLKQILPSDDYVIFNCKELKNIGIMFYTDFIAYDKPLPEPDYKALKSRNIKLAVIDNGRLPDYLSNDPAVFKIKAPDSTWE